MEISWIVLFLAITNISLKSSQQSIPTSSEPTMTTQPTAANVSTLNPSITLTTLLTVNQTTSKTSESSATSTSTSKSSENSNSTITTVAVTSDSTGDNNSKTTLKTTITSIITVPSTTSTTASDSSNSPPTGSDSTTKKILPTTTEPTNQTGSVSTSATTTPLPTSEPTTAPSLLTSEPTTAPSLLTSEPTTAPSLLTSEPTTAPPLLTSEPTTAPPLPTSKPTTAPPVPKVLISETNFLLTNLSIDSYFLELQVSEEDVAEIWLVVVNASDTTQLLNKTLNLTTYRGRTFLFEVKSAETELWNKIRNLESVLIALYSNKEDAEKISPQVEDFLMYSSFGNIDKGLHEKFIGKVNPDLIIDISKLTNLTSVSLSRCSGVGKANAATVLTNQTRNDTNLCNLTVNTSLEMKLIYISSEKCSRRIENFNKSLENAVITNVNKKAHCGFALYMLSDLNIRTKTCDVSKIEKNIDVGFTVRSAFKDQLALIWDGYQQLFNESNFEIGDDSNFELRSCSGDCFPTEPPATNRTSDDDKIRVTVAVVLSCIGVFLLVLMLVILYLRKKKKGILQFRMSRLDEDDDLIGDMDDFVGNQGPTFRSFR